MSAAVLHEDAQADLREAATGIGVKDVLAAQLATCRRFGAEGHPTAPEAVLGVARAVETGLHPLNGLRHPAEGGTSGWYLWAGEEFSEAPDFFEPLHADHLHQRCLEVLPYLGLPPGWRFLLADGTRTYGSTARSSTSDIPAGRRGGIRRGAR